jgi:hypothetical protein
LATNRRGRGKSPVVRQLRQLATINARRRLEFFFSHSPYVDTRKDVGLQPLHRVVHDRKQQVFFALDVVVQPSLGQIDRGRDVFGQRRLT